ncbi:MAG: hypothetical protein KBB70_02785 [Candidatus Pacebacteria bacterium]|nr:hypothetical protein [Candidatus Paceibacterota bacterium]
MKTPNNGFTPIMIILIIAIVTAISGGAYVVVKKQNQQPTAQQNSEAEIKNTASDPQASAGATSNTVQNNSSVTINIPTPSTINSPTSGIDGSHLVGTPRNPTFATPVVTNISTNGVTLSTTVIDVMNRYPGQTIYFEYGTMQYNFDNATKTTISGPIQGTYAQNISGLSPNTTYYARATINNGPSVNSLSQFSSSPTASFRTKSTVACAANVPPSITVIKPNGGGVFMNASGMYTSWTTTCDIDPTATMHVELVAAGGSHSGEVFPLVITPNDGTESSYMPTVPLENSQAEGDPFKLRIWTTLNGVTISDESDATFTVYRTYN